MVDVFEKMIKDAGPIGRHVERAHGYFAFPKLEGELGSRMFFRGKEKIVWSLNNYLGLVNHPETRKIDTKAAANWGIGNPMGTRIMSGNTTMHEELEKILAEFVSREDAMLLNFGYQGIMSCIDSLVNRRDVIVYDVEAHACLVDGVRLHMGFSYTFKHNNVEDCEKQLQRAEKMAGKNGGGILVITEGVFGMSGNQGNLKGIIKLNEKGFDIGTTNSPVTPVYMKGDVPEATAMVMDLRENYNIFCSIVVYPIIPKGQIIFRLIPTAAHTDEDIELTLKAFEETKKNLDAGAYQAENIPDMA